MSHSHSTRHTTAAKPSKRPAEVGVEHAETTAVAEPDDSTRDDKVREIAYFYYEARGCIGGHEFDDWLKAEAEFERGQATHAKGDGPAPGTQ